MDLEEVKVDGERWISAEGGPQEPVSSPGAYSISARERLLLRYESLISIKDSIKVDAQHPVLLTLELLNADQLSASAMTLVSSVLMVCPLIKNWMMLATWRTAYPMPGGRWRQEGSDMETSQCVFGQIKTDAQTKRATLVFDVSDWFLRFVRASSVNFGVVLVSQSNTPVGVLGSGHPTGYPKFSWTRIR